MKRSRTAFVLGLAMVVLSACSEDPVPKVAPHESPAPSVSESASVGPLEPTMPAAARKHNADGAVAFVKYYWAMADYALATGELSGLSRLGSENCSACQGGIKGVRDIYAAGGRVSGGETTVSPIGTSRLSQDVRSYVVRVRIRNARQVIHYPDRKSDVYPAGVATARFIVDQLAGGWSIGFWEDVS